MLEHGEHYREHQRKINPQKFSFQLSYNVRYADMQINIVKIKISVTPRQYDGLSVSYWKSVN